MSSLPDLPDSPNPPDLPDPTDQSPSLDPSQPIEAESEAESEAERSAGERSEQGAHDASGADPLEPPPEEVEGATPPGYDWPTHGGYLGCLVGALGACPVVGFIAANIWALFHASRLALPLFALLMLGSLAAVVAIARLGWVLGRRFYRYYPQPHPTWGENDAAAAALEAESAAAEREKKRRTIIP